MPALPATTSIYFTLQHTHLGPILCKHLPSQPAPPAKEGEAFFFFFFPGACFKKALLQLKRKEQSGRLNPSRFRAAVAKQGPHLEEWGLKNFFLSP